MFFKQGKCNRSTCGFSHDLTLLKREPCVFHHLFKGCKKGAEACGHSHEAIGEEERRRLQEDHDRFKAVLEARRVALREVEEERTRIETPEWVRALAEKRVEFDAGLVEATREGGVGDGEAVDTAAEMTSKALPVHGEVAPEAGPGPATTGNISRLEEAVDEEEIPEVWSTETGSRANIYDSFMNVMFKF
ncbi:hypothetical protein HK101_007478 [Irineochytrium annulatum]|nr:hypothetical protein HK101_007478 [Irineochytrium annulatum]